MNTTSPLANMTKWPPPFYGHMRRISVRGRMRSVQFYMHYDGLQVNCRNEIEGHEVEEVEEVGGVTASSKKNSTFPILYEQKKK